MLTLPFAPVCLTTIQADSQSEQESDHVERELLFAGDTCVRSLLSSLIFDPCVFVCFFPSPRSIMLMEPPLQVLDERRPSRLC